MSVTGSGIYECQCHSLSYLRYRVFISTNLPTFAKQCCHTIAAIHQLLLLVLIKMKVLKLLRINPLPSYILFTKDIPVHFRISTEPTVSAHIVLADSLSQLPTKVEPFSPFLLLACVVAKKGQIHLILIWFGQMILPELAFFVVKVKKLT